MLPQPEPRCAHTQPRPLCSHPRSPAAATALPAPPPPAAGGHGWRSSPPARVQAARAGSGVGKRAGRGGGTGMGNGRVWDANQTVTILHSRTDSIHNCKLAVCLRCTSNGRRGGVGADAEHSCRSSEPVNPPLPSALPILTSSSSIVTDAVSSSEREATGTPAFSTWGARGNKSLHEPMLSCCTDREGRQGRATRGLVRAAEKARVCG